MARFRGGSKKRTASAMAGTRIRGIPWRMRKRQTRFGGSQYLELKSRTGASILADVLTTGNVLHIGGIALGTDIDQRIGRTLTYRKIMFNIEIIPTGGTLTSSYRILILYDKQPNGALPTLDTILTGGAPHGPLNFKEIDSRDRFTTLYNSGIITLNGNAAPESTWNTEIFLDVNLPATMNAAPATIGSYVTGSLLFVTLGSKTVGGQGHQISFEDRVRFIDGGRRIPKVFKQSTKSSQFKRSN